MGNTTFVITAQDGESAYEVWLRQPGNAGKTEQEFLESLKATPGDLPEDVMRQQSYDEDKDLEVDRAGYAREAGHAQTAGSAQTATTAQSATSAAQAQFATEAGHAATADSATTAANATNANRANSAASADAVIWDNITGKPSAFPYTQGDVPLAKILVNGTNGYILYVQDGKLVVGPPPVGGGDPVPLGAYMEVSVYDPQKTGKVSLAVKAEGLSSAEAALDNTAYMKKGGVEGWHAFPDPANLTEGNAVVTSGKLDWGVKDIINWPRTLLTAGTTITGFTNLTAGIRRIQLPATVGEIKFLGTGIMDLGEDSPYEERILELDCRNPTTGSVDVRVRSGLWGIAQKVRPMGIGTGWSLPAPMKGLRHFAYHTQVSTGGNHAALLPDPQYMSGTIFLDVLLSTGHNVNEAVVTLGASTEVFYSGIGLNSGEPAKLLAGRYIIQYYKDELNKRCYHILPRNSRGYVYAKPLGAPKTTGVVNLGTPDQYGKPETPIAGNISFTGTAVRETYVTIYHSGASKPIFTLPAGYTLHKAGGTYAVGQLNKIMLVISPGRIEATTHPFTTW